MFVRRSPTPLVTLVDLVSKVQFRNRNQDLEDSKTSVEDDLILKRRGVAKNNQDSEHGD